MTVEDRLVAAFNAVRTDVVEHPDLFARVNRSLADARARRRWRQRVAVGGILLLMGLLHSANVVALPVIGRLLALNRRLDDGQGPESKPAGPPPGGGVPSLGPGTWIVRVEPGGPTPGGD